jgi:hypothetical protein
LFVGSGIVIPPGGTWIGLVSKIADRCRVKRKTSEPLPDLIDRCLTPSRRKICNDAFREEFPKHSVVTRTALVSLHRLSFKSLLTTNFDPWIHQQSRIAHYKVVHKYPDLPLSGIGLSGGLFYLHGYFDPDSSDPPIDGLIFGRTSFEDAYRESLLPGFLLNVFTYENVLFVGFDPTENNIARILLASRQLRTQIARSLHTTPTVRHFILFPVSDGMTGAELARHAKSVEDLLALGIIPVQYAKKGDDFRGLEEVLAGWIDLGELQERPAPFATGF